RAPGRTPAPPSGRSSTPGPSPVPPAPASWRRSSAGTTPGSAPTRRSARSATAPARLPPSNRPSAPAPPTRTGNSASPTPSPRSATAAGPWITCGPRPEPDLPGRGRRQRLERLEHTIQMTEHGLLRGLRILRDQRRHDRFVLRERDAGPARHERQRERVADRLVAQLPKDPGARLVVRDLLDHRV